MKMEMTLGRILAGIAILAVILLLVTYAVTRINAPVGPLAPPSSTELTSKPAPADSDTPSPKGASPSRSTSGRSASRSQGAKTPPSRTVRAGGPGDRSEDAPPTELDLQIEGIKGLETYAERRLKLIELANELAAEDFLEALETVKGIKDGRIRSQLLKNIFHYQGAHDHDGALAAAAEMQPQREGRRPTREFYDKDKVYRGLLSATMQGWATTGPLDAMEHLNQLPADYRGQAQLAVYKGWAEVDPKDALTFAENTSVELRNSVVGDVAFAWSRNDPAACADYVNGLEDIHPGGQQLVLNTALGHWAETDIKGALDWANGAIADDKQFEDTVLKVARDLSRHAPERAAELIGMVPEIAGMQAGLTHRIADEWSKSHPDKAAEWSSSIGDDAQRATAIKLIASNWASDSADDALSWARDLPDESERAFALSNIAVRQAQAKSEDAVGWIRQLPSGFVRARTTAGYALGALRAVNDFRSASLLQQQIGNEAVNIDKVREIVEHSSIPDGERDDILALMR